MTRTGSHLPNAPSAPPTCEESDHLKHTVMPVDWCFRTS